MTREEAIAALLKRVAYVKVALKYFETDGEDRDNYKESISAYEIAIDALRGPVPDPETGLVTCGCGGSPEYESYDSEWLVKCKNYCPASTYYKGTKEEAAEEWNRMMGYEGGAR